MKSNKKNIIKKVEVATEPQKNNIKIHAPVIISEVEKMENVALVAFDNKKIEAVELEEVKMNNATGLFLPEQVIIIKETLRRRAENQKSYRHEKWLNGKANKVEREESDQPNQKWIQLSPINVSGFYSKTKTIEVKKMLALTN